ncbi:MAG: ankyrin repeat domain-containing protein [Rudaea sp.]
MMPKKRLPISHTARSTLVWFGIAVAAFAVAIYFQGAPAFAALLIAEAASMQVVVRLARPRPGSSLRRDAGNAVVYLSMLAVYSGFGAAVIGYPFAWLRSEASLGAALAVSAAVVLSLLALWRVWPAFAAVAVRRTASQSNAFSGRLRAAWRLTADNEVFFSHGLLVALALLALTQGALWISGVATTAARDPWRATTVGIFAGAVPVLSWLIFQRSVSAWLLDRRRTRTGSMPEPAMTMPDTPVEAPAEQTLATSASGLSETDLNAMLLRCVRAGQTQLALAALEHGADPDSAPPPLDRDQRAALILAVLNPDLRLLRGFIARGADLERAHAGLPALIAATRDSREGRPEAVMTLLTNGARADCADADGHTPLHFAALSARPIVAALLCDAGARLDAINRDGQTPLAVACAASNWDLVRFLLERGAATEPAQAQPAIIAAAATAEDDAQGVQLLLKRRARVDARDTLHRTALITAALNGHVAIVRVLLDAGARVDAADAHGTTALMEAARADAYAVLDTLAPFRPSPDAVDHAGRTALTIAAQSLRTGEESVRRLLTLGISRQLPARDGRRAVDFAAAGGRWNIVALLDPEYPRPANLGDGSPAAAYAEDSAEHLLDALRFANWHVVEKFGGAVRGWPQAVCARLYLALARQADATAARSWLLDRGLDPNACDEVGVPLLQAALAQLPDTLTAANQLFETGAQPAGCGVLAQICAACVPANAPRAELEHFALRLIERGADLFGADAEARTPLAHAVAQGCTELCAALLARGVDPNTTDRKGRTPLFSALTTSPAVAEGLVKMLLRAGADPEVRAANNETPLGLELARAQPVLQQWLNWPGWKPPRRVLRADDLIAAAGAGDATAVDKLLALGLAVDAVDVYGASALLHAAAHNQIDVAAQLIDRGANTAHTAADNTTALSVAVAARHASMIDLLVSRGADANQRLAGGGTALMIAAAHGDPETAAQLLARGARADAADEHGMTALHMAAQFAFARADAARARHLFAALLDAGAAVDARNVDGQTALLVLLGARAQPRSGTDQKVLLELLGVLRARGAAIDRQDERGVGVLHACAMHGLLLPARTLLAAGADPDCRDLLERMPRDVAHVLGFIDVAAELGSESRRVI